MGQHLKDYFLEERFEDDVPEVFSYCYKYFAQYLDYKPFFTCFEKGRRYLRIFVIYLGNKTNTYSVYKRNKLFKENSWKGGV